MTSKVKTAGGLLKQYLSERHLLKHSCVSGKGISVSWGPGIYSRIVCKTYLGLSNLVVGMLNNTHFANREQLFDLVDNRNGRGLLTVSNHTSRLDDPMLWAILREHSNFNLDKLRWTTAAADVCFKKQFHTDAMGWGKVVPLVRGDGVYQKSMDFCVAVLNANEWVHFFPEGAINIKQEYMRLKWGCSRLLMDCSIPPVVLPIHHIGFDNICLNEGFMKYFLRFGKKASVYVGQPIDFTSEIEKMRHLKLSVEEMRIKITERIQEEMFKVKQKAEHFHNTSHDLSQQR